MARKKKGGRHHKSHHRRPRVGAMGHGMMDDLTWSLGNGVGQVAASAMQRVGTGMNVKMVSGAQAVAGILLRRHLPSSFGQGLASGVNGAGIMGLAHEFGVLKGVDDICSRIVNPMMQPGNMQSQPTQIQAPVGARTAGLNNWNQVSGIDNYETMSGFNNWQMMSGAEDTYQAEYEGVQSLGM